MQLLRRIPRRAFIALMALIAVLITVAFCLTPRFAIAEESGEPIQITGESSALHVVYIPHLQWEDVSSESMPALHALASNGAVANMSAPWSDIKEEIESAPHLVLYRLAEGQSWEQYDQQVAALAAQLDNSQYLLVVSAAVFSGTEQEANNELTPTIIAGDGFDGYTTSNITHRVGLVAAGDIIHLADYLNQGHGLSKTASTEETGVQNHASSEDINTRIAHLQNAVATTDAITDSKGYMGLVFLTLIFIASGLSVFLLAFGYSSSKDPRSRLIPPVRILWLVILACPPASFLMFLFLPNLPAGYQLMLIASIWVALIAFAALMVGWRTRWVNSLFFLLLLSIVVIAIGQLFGGPLSSPGYFTYNITEGFRYYGMSNEQGAIFFGAWFTFSGLLINRFSDAKGIRAFRRWGFLLVSAVLLFIAISPWFGASFGPIVWAVFGTVLIWWLFNGHRLRLRYLLLVVLFSGMLAVGILLLDLQFNPTSHMQEYNALFNESVFAMLVGLLQIAWDASIMSIVTYMPIPAIIFFLAIVVFLVTIRLFKPGAYREFWGHNKPFGAVFAIGLYIALITFLLEDSGLFTPAIFLIYPISGLVWLICDMHSWHLRELGMSSEPMTVRQLLRTRLESDTYKSLRSSSQQYAANGELGDTGSGGVKAHGSGREKSIDSGGGDNNKEPNNSEGRDGGASNGGNTAQNGEA